MLERYVKRYNEYLPQRYIRHHSPCQAIKEWRKNQLGS